MDSVHNRPFSFSIASGTVAFTRADHTRTWLKVTNSTEHAEVPTNVLVHVAPLRYKSSYEKSAVIKNVYFFFLVHDACTNAIQFAR